MNASAFSFPQVKLVVVIDNKKILEDRHLQGFYVM